MSYYLLSAVQRQSIIVNDHMGCRDIAWHALTGLNMLKLQICLMERYILMDYG